MGYRFSLSGFAVIRARNFFGFALPLSEKFMEQLEKLKLTALHEVNAVRLSYDSPILSEFPKGRKRSNDACPVARALGCFVVRWSGTGPTIGHLALGYFDHDEAQKVGKVIGQEPYRAADYCGIAVQHLLTAPTIIRQFVEAFYLGQYPELVE